MAIFRPTIEIQAVLSNIETGEKSIEIFTRQLTTMHPINSEKYNELIEVATSELIDEIEESLTDDTELINVLTKVI